MSAPVPPRCEASLTLAFTVLGKRWTGIVLARLSDGPAGFSELTRDVEGISQSVLSERLAELGRLGLVERTVQEGPPLGVRYALTSSGEALAPALDALASWAGEHLDPAECVRRRAAPHRATSAA